MPEDPVSCTKLVEEGHARSTHFQWAKNQGRLGPGRPRPGSTTQVRPGDIERKKYRVQAHFERHASLFPFFGFPSVRKTNWYPSPRPRSGPGRKQVGIRVVPQAGNSKPPLRLVCRCSRNSAAAYSSIARPARDAATGHSQTIFRHTEDTCSG